MKNLYNELYSKMNKYKMTYLFHENYFKSLSKEELTYILNLDDEKLKLYFKIISILYKKQILSNSFIEDITKKVLYIAFSNNNSNKQKSFFELITETKFLQAKNIIPATIDFLNIEESYKRDSLIDIFESYNRIYNINANKIVFDVKNCKNKKQVDVLFNLFRDRKTLNSKNISKIVSMIKKYPNFKYYNYFVSLIIEHDFLNIDYLEKFFLIKDSDQAKTYYNAIINLPINNSIYLDFINNIIKNNYQNYSYLNVLISNHKKINSHLFKKFVNALNNTNNLYQSKAIISLIDEEFLNDDIILDIFIKGILNSSKEIQIDYILKLKYYDYIFNDLVFSNYLISSIAKIKKQYQLICLFKCIRKIYNRADYMTIIDTIVNSNKLICYYLPELLKNNILVKRYDFLKILNEFNNLKSSDQIELFLHIINQENIFNYDISILYKIKNLNKYQCETIFKLFDLGFYETKYYKLIKYILLFKDDKHIKIFNLIITNIDNIGYDKAIELINNILNSSVDLDTLFKYISAKVNNSSFVIENFNIELINDELTHEVKKLKSLKLKM